MADELAYTPDSVPTSVTVLAVDGHPSRTAIAGGLQQPTRMRQWITVAENVFGAYCLVLLPVGFT